MIKIADKQTLEFIEFLNNQNLTNKECRIMILQGYDCCHDKDGNKGFAAYKVEDKVILLPSEVPVGIEFEDFIIFNLAHEYKHFLQDVNGEKFKQEEDEEEDANEFAEEMVNKFRNNK